MVVTLVERMRSYASIRDPKHTEAPRHLARGFWRYLLIEGFLDDLDYLASVQDEGVEGCTVGGRPQ